MYKVPVMQMYNFLGGPKYGMRTIVKNTISYGFSGGSDGKESACNAGDLGLTLGLRRSPGEGNDNPLQYSSLKNPVDRGVWWAADHEVAELDMTERLTLSLSFQGCFGAQCRSADCSQSMIR